MAFAYLITVLMFARADLYADRPRRPGLARIATALFQVTIIALVFALANGEHFSSYYIFYGSLFFARRLHRGAARDPSSRHRLAAGAGRLRARALLVGSGKHIEAVAHALEGRSRMGVQIAGYVSLVPAPAERAAFARADGRPARRARPRAHPGRDHRRPRLPAGQGGRAGGPLPPARHHRPGRTVDDGDPDRPRRVRAGPDRAAVQAPPAGVPGDRLRAEADLRPGRRDRRAVRALAAAAGDRGSP